MALAAGQWPVAEVASREELASQGPPGDKTRQYRLLRREGESVLFYPFFLSRTKVGFCEVEYRLWCCQCKEQCRKGEKIKDHVEKAHTMDRFLSTDLTLFFFIIYMPV